MLCSNCKKNTAVYHYTENINGYVKEAHLCPECYKKLKLSSEFENFDMFSPLFSGNAIANNYEVCKVCGTTFKEFEKTGLVGCPKCYEAFKPLMKDAILQLHGKSNHIGKNPYASDKNHDLNVKKRRLLRDMDEAIREKRFSDADVLNKEIKKIDKLFDDND